MSEFDIIEKYFAPLTMGRAEAAGLRDDAAVLSVPDGQELVVTTDTLSAGMHFFDGMPAEVVAQKALRSNLSDLAAMGAVPHSYQLAIAFADAPDEAWLSAFCDGLMVDNDRYGVFCSGGDTTRTKGALTITMTAMGFVPAGKAVRRGGAKAGDMAIVTGVIGKGYAAFKRDETIAPEVVCSAADAICDYAHAAVDVSDGLLADAGHIAAASGLALDLYLADIPVEGEVMEAVTGGDDYVLVLAVAADKRDICMQALQAAGMSPAVIGAFKAGEGVCLLDENGNKIIPEKSGWSHF